MTAERKAATRDALTFDLLTEPLSVLRFSADAEVPDWALSAGSFGNVTRTADELSIVCATAHVPALRTSIEARREDGWRALKVVGPFAFTEVGVLLQVAAPLAAAGISILAMATFDTDYVLVQEAQLGRAVAVLHGAGHTVRDRDAARREPAADR